MKASIVDGELKIYPENDTERYALRKWDEENNTSEDDGINMCLYINKEKDND